MALSAPLVALCLVAVLAAAGILGITRLRADDALDDLLRSKSPEYLTFERFRASFPTSELDVVVVAHLPTPVAADILERLRDLHLDLALGPGVANVFSMFTTHRPDAQTGRLVPIIAAPLPSGTEYTRLLGELAEDKLVAGRFYRRLADGSALALLVAELDRATVQEKGLTTVVAGVSDEIRRLASTARLRLEVTGAPVMKTDILNASIADSRLFNIAGFAIGIGICWLFFRNLRLLLLVLVPTTLAVLCSIGLIGLLGQSLNPLMNTIIPLVMVMSFSNGLHLVFAIRGGFARGTDRRAAIADAVMTVGPACVLSAATTAIAFASLTLTDSRLVNTFGLTAAAATGLSLLLIVVAMPPLALFLFPAEVDIERKSPADAASPFDHGLDRLCRWLSRHVIANAMLIAAVGGIALVGSSWLYLQLEPRYRLTDIIPDSRETATAAALVDKEFGGLNVLHVMISWRGTLDEQAEDIWSAIDDVHRLLAAEPLLANTRSINEIHWQGPQGGRFGSAWIDSLPMGLAGRYFSADRQAAVISANARDVEARQLDGLRRDIEARLDTVRQRHPALAMELTGFAPLSASRAIHTIGSLNRGMLTAMLIVVLLLAVLFRSVELALIGFSVNLFAVVATGAWLYFSHTGLQYVSVVGLTVAFGIAVDDTVHFLNRFRLAMEAGLPWRAAVKNTLEHTGPILVLTTIVVVCGMATTLASDVPPTRIFGMLAITTLLFALFGDIVILPACLIAYRRIRLHFARKERWPMRARSG